jgi:hypothetical protein
MFVLLEEQKQVKQNVFKMLDLFPDPTFMVTADVK